MTVKHLRSVQRQQLALAAAADSTVVGKYRAGFSECAQEVTRYLTQVEGLHPEARCKLENHLQNCLLQQQQQQQQQQTHVTNLHQSHPQNFNQYSSLANQQPSQQLHVTIPGSTPMTSLPGGATSQPITQQQQLKAQQIPILNTQGLPQFLGAFQMVPGAVLANDVTLLLPATQVTSYSGNYQSSGTSVSPSSVRTSPGSTGSRESSSCPGSPSPAPPPAHAASSSTHHVTNQVTSAHSWPQLALPSHQLPPNPEEKVWRPWWRRTQCLYTCISLLCLCSPIHVGENDIPHWTCLKLENSQGKITHCQDLFWTFDTPLRLFMFSQIFDSCSYLILWICFCFSSC